MLDGRGVCSLSHPYPVSSLFTPSLYIPSFSIHRIFLYIHTPMYVTMQADYEVYHSQTLHPVVSLESVLSNTLNSE